jgi:hypothetical protein
MSSYSNSSSSSSSSYGVMQAVWFIVGATCSFLINKSVMWAILHGFFGGFYVLYLCFGCGGGLDSVQNEVDRLLAPEVTVEVPVYPEPLPEMEAVLLPAPE